MSLRLPHSLTSALVLALCACAFGAWSVRADDGHSAPAEHVPDASSQTAHDGHAHTPVPSDESGHPGEHPESPDDHGGDHGGIDYNAAPLPGSAPGMGTLFVFSLILFGGFVLAARTLLWTPLIDALDQREARVNQAYAEAEAVKAQAEQLLAQHEARMAEVHEQVHGIVAQARKEAEQEKARIVAEAEGHARELRERTIAEICSARDDAMSQLNQSLDSEVAKAVEQLVGHPV
ncbi:MAG: ATP synthase F0 subunit B [Planctomycetaceae bacterium]|nr:ATP synthase F0 subunit B [Planctomycetaceae bacterium]